MARHQGAIDEASSPGEGDALVAVDAEDVPDEVPLLAGANYHTKLHMHWVREMKRLAKLRRELEAKLANERAVEKIWNESRLGIGFCLFFRALDVTL